MLATARGDRLHETERGGRHLDGEEPGPAHPLTVALPTADSLKDLAREEGTVLGPFVGEDATIRGVPGRAREARLARGAERGRDGGLVSWRPGRPKGA